jgi:hypothetical protein
MFDKAAVMMRTTPAECAREMLAGIRKGKRRIVVGHLSWVMFWLPRLFPSSYHRFIKSYMP